MFEFQIEQNGEHLDVTCKGRLDAAQAPKFMEDMKQYTHAQIKQIIFHAEELEYIASAGIRVIVFTKQKIGQDVTVVMEKPCAQVESVLEMTGISKFIEIIK